MSIFKPVIISAPFGNYRIPYTSNCTRTLGTFTANARGSRVEPFGSKWWRVIKTVRYLPFCGGWRNKLGLKNPGIKWLADAVQRQSINVSDKIISIYGFNDAEWKTLILNAAGCRPLAIEINASCPNVHKLEFSKQIFESAMNVEINYGIKIIVKIPPVFFEPIVSMATNAGISIFHACNTLPTPVGGLSGKPLIKISQGVVGWLRQHYPTIPIIGGGGITTPQDAIDYMQVGANRVAIGTLLFNPFLWRRIGMISSAVANFHSWDTILNANVK